jgi:hypothetical protein
MGTKNCKELKPYTDKNGNKIIFSTFSPEFGKKGYTINTGPYKFALRIYNGYNS